MTDWRTEEACRCLDGLPRLPPARPEVVVPFAFAVAFTLSSIGHIIRTQWALKFSFRLVLGPWSLKGSPIRPGLTPTHTQTHTETQSQTGSALDVGFAFGFDSAWIIFHDFVAPASTEYPFAVHLYLNVAVSLPPSFIISSSPLLNSFNLFVSSWVCLLLSLSQINCAKGKPGYHTHPHTPTHTHTHTNMQTARRDIPQCSMQQRNNAIYRTVKQSLINCN